MYGVPTSISLSFVGEVCVVICGYKVGREQGNAVLKTRSPKAVKVHTVFFRSTAPYDR
jgi:hypothetical protein